jgi:hypothetical protein
MESVVDNAKWFVLHMRVDFYNYNYFNECVRHFLMRLQNFDPDEIDIIFSSQNYIKLNPWCWYRNSHYLSEEPKLELDITKIFTMSLRNALLFEAQEVTSGNLITDGEYKKPFDYRTVRHSYPFNRELEQQMKKWEDEWTKRKPSHKCI